MFLKFQNTFSNLVYLFQFSIDNCDYKRILEFLVYEILRENSRLHSTSIYKKEKIRIFESILLLNILTMFLDPKNIF